MEVLVIIGLTALAGATLTNKETDKVELSKGIRKEEKNSAETVYSSNSVNEANYTLYSQLEDNYSKIDDPNSPTPFIGSLGYVGKKTPFETVPTDTLGLFSGVKTIEEKLPPPDFKPFYKGSVKQPASNGAYLETFTGNAAVRPKVETFTNADVIAPVNIFTTDDRDLQESRVYVSGMRNGDTYAPSARDKPAKALDISDSVTTALYSQPTIDQLRIVSNPKLTLGGVIVPGQRGQELTMASQTSNNTPSTSFDIQDRLDSVAKFAQQNSGTALGLRESVQFSKVCAKGGAKEQNVDTFIPDKSSLPDQIYTKGLTNTRTFSGDRFYTPPTKSGDTRLSSTLLISNESTTATPQIVPGKSQFTKEMSKGIIETPVTKKDTALGTQILNARGRSKESQRNAAISLKNETYALNKWNGVKKSAHIKATLEYTFKPKLRNDNKKNSYSAPGTGIVKGKTLLDTSTRVKKEISEVYRKPVGVRNETRKLKGILKTSRESVAPAQEIPGKLGVAQTAMWETTNLLKANPQAGDRILAPAFKNPFGPVTNGNTQVFSPY